MGKPKDPDYWKKWRAEHPEYREQERVRSRARKRKRTPEQRRAERERARLRAQRTKREKAYDREWMRKKRAERTSYEVGVENALKRYRMNVSSHIKAWRGEKREQALKSRDLRAMRWMKEAHRIVGSIIKRDERTKVYDPLYEDALGECLTLLVYNRKVATERRERIVTEAVRAYVKRERSIRWWAAYEVNPELV